MSRKSTALCLTGVLLLTLAAYLPSLWNGYAMDDRLVAMGTYQGQKHPMVYDLKPLEAYFKAHYWQGRGKNLGLYRPVTVWSYAAVHHLFKPHEFDPDDREQKETAVAQHAVNLLLHLAATLVVFGLFLRLRISGGPALLGTLVFGLHAIHSEVVASVVGRAELIGFVSGATAVWVFYLDRWKPAAWAASALLFFLAFAAKENAVGWVGFLVVFSLARQGLGAEKGTLKSALADLGARLPVALIPLLVYLGLRWSVVRDMTVDPPVYLVNPLAHEPAATRILTAVFLWGWKGLGLTLAPFHLACDHGVAVSPVITRVLDLRFLAPAAVLLLIGIGGVAAARRHPLVFLASASFLGFSFLTSNVPFAIGTLFGERLYYTPGLGLAFLAAWLLGRVRSRPGFRWGFRVLAGVWICACVVVILQRNRVWDCDQVLFLTDVERQPRSARLHLCAATVHMEREDPVRALTHLKEATRLDPGNALAWNSLGALHFDQGRNEEAEASIRRGLRSPHVSEPEDVFRIHCNLGIVLMGLGRKEEAAGHFTISLFGLPAHERAWKELLDLHTSPGDLIRLLDTIREGESKSGGDPHWKWYRGCLLMKLDRHKEAAAVFGSLSRDARAPESLRRRAVESRRQIEERGRN